MCEHGCGVWVVHGTRITSPVALDRAHPLLGGRHGGYHGHGCGRRPAHHGSAGEAARGVVPRGWRVRHAAVVAVVAVRRVELMCLHAHVWVLPRYGGLFNVVDEMKAELQGIGGADSVVVDPHKTLFTSCA